MEPYTFVVFGKAAPQGSKVMTTTGRGKTFMRESSNRLGAWRTAVKRAALGPDGLPGARFDGPVQVEIEFEFRQPKSNEDAMPTARHFGDIDKLTRAVLDALVMAGVLADDSLVVWVVAVKRFGDDDRTYITVTDVLSIKAEPLKLSGPNPFRPFQCFDLNGCGRGDDCPGGCVL